MHSLGIRRPRSKMSGEHTRWIINIDVYIHVKQMHVKAMTRQSKERWERRDALRTPELEWEKERWEERRWIVTLIIMIINIQPLEVSCCSGEEKRRSFLFATWLATNAGRERAWGWASVRGEKKDEKQREGEKAMKKQSNVEMNKSENKK